MDFYDPFEDFEHKLWSKERPKVKLPIWLSTIKSQELSWFTYVQVVCHILLERFQQRLQLFFRSHLNQRSSQKVMGLQNCGSPDLGSFGTPNLGVLRKNDIWVQVPWPGKKNIIRGKVMVSPKFKPWWILWVLWVRVCL
jgi:hypothetical protein